MNATYLGQTDSIDTRSLLTRLRDWFADSAVVNAAVDVQEFSIAETQAAIQNLYAAGLAFQDAYQQLQSVAGQAALTPELQQQYDDLMSRGNVIGTAIRDAVATAQTVTQWVEDNTGVDISTVPPASLQGLGFVQLIPLAIIGAVIAATALAVAWIVDARSAITKIQALQQLVTGIPPEQQAAVIHDALAQSGGIANTVSKTTTLVVIGAVIAAGIFFAPEAKRLLQRIK